MIGTELEDLIKRLTRLPGLGPRSARRLALHLLEKKEGVMIPLLQSMQTASEAIKPCSICGNMDSCDPCHICSDADRDTHALCVVQQISDLWALERTRSFRGTYHILGGLLSALDGIRPQDLRIEQLIQRIKDNDIKEVILALSATVDGQTTAHYIAEAISHVEGVQVTRLAQGVPVGGELDYLDEGTLVTAMKSRSSVGG